MTDQQNEPDSLGPMILLGIVTFGALALLVYCSSGCGISGELVDAAQDSAEYAADATDETYETAEEIGETFGHINGILAEMQRWEQQRQRRIDQIRLELGDDVEEALPVLQEAEEALIAHGVLRERLQAAAASGEVQVEELESELDDVIAHQEQLDERLKEMEKLTGATDLANTAGRFLGLTGGEWGGVGTGLGGLGLTGYGVHRLRRRRGGRDRDRNSADVQEDRHESANAMQMLHMMEELRDSQRQQAITQNTKPEQPPAVSEIAAT